MVSADANSNVLTHLSPLHSSLTNSFPVFIPLGRIFPLHTVQDHRGGMCWAGQIWLGKSAEWVHPFEGPSDSSRFSPHPPQSSWIHVMIMSPLLSFLCLRREDTLRNFAWFTTQNHFLGIQQFRTTVLICLAFGVALLLDWSTSSLVFHNDSLAPKLREETSTVLKHSSCCGAQRRLEQTCPWLISTSQTKLRTAGKPLN